MIYITSSRSTGNDSSCETEKKNIIFAERNQLYEMASRVGRNIFFKNW